MRPSRAPPRMTNRMTSRASIRAQRARRSRACAPIRHSPPRRTARRSRSAARARQEACDACRRSRRRQTARDGVVHRRDPERGNAGSAAATTLRSCCSIAAASPRVWTMSVSQSRCDWRSGRYTRDGRDWPSPAKVASSTTPTIVTSGPDALPRRARCPTGSLPGQMRVARRRLTIITRGAPRNRSS